MLSPSTERKEEGFSNITLLVVALVVFSWTNKWDGRFVITTGDLGRKKKRMIR